MKLDRQLPAERFEAAASQSAAPSPPPLKEPPRHQAQPSHPGMTPPPVPGYFPSSHAALFSELRK